MAATAASKPLPPDSRMSRAARVASGWGVATAARGAIMAKSFSIERNRRERGCAALKVSHGEAVCNGGGAGGARDVRASCVGGGALTATVTPTFSRRERGKCGRDDAGGGAI